MTLQEALDLLHVAKWLLYDTGFAVQAQSIEDVETKLLLFQMRNEAPGKETLKQYAALLLPPGRRGRAKLVLRRPEEARALAMTKGILLSVEV